MKENRKQKNTKKGFTLIETLVAIFILLVSTTGPLSFAQSGLRASFLARDQVVAFYLAQDVTETVKNIRDNNSLNGDDWLLGLNACLDAKGCKMETGQALNITTCSTTPCGPMYYASSTREYVLNSGTGRSPSKYTRTMYLKEIVPDKEAQMIVVVEWDSTFFAERRIIVQENIYNSVSPRPTP
jgi:prepilin-type N-terminal cleavage/methylation domain-containing protein